MKKDKTLNELANNRRNKFAVIKIDETEYWHEAMQKQAGTIFGVYLVDLTKPTHCCSLSVSFPAENFKNFFPNPPKNWDDDLLTRYEIDGDFLRDDIAYLDGNSIYEIEKMYNSGTLEDAMENERANPCIC